MYYNFTEYDIKCKKRESIVYIICSIIFLFFTIFEFVLLINDYKYFSYNKTNGIIESHECNNSKYNCTYNIVYNINDKEYNNKIKINDYYEDGYKIDIRYNKNNYNDITLEKKVNNLKIIRVGFFMFLIGTILCFIASIVIRKKVNNTIKSGYKHEFNEDRPYYYKTNKKGFVSALVFSIIFGIILITMIMNFISDYKYFSYVKTKATLENVSCSEKIINSDDEDRFDCYFSLSFIYNNEEYKVNNLRNNYDERKNNGDTIDFYYDKNNLDNYSLEEYNIMDSIIALLIIFILFISFIYFTIILYRKMNNININNNSNSNDTSNNELYFINEFDDEISGEMYFPLFDKRVEIWASKEVDVDYIKECILEIQKIKDTDNIVLDYVEALENYSDYYIKNTYDWKKDYDNPDKIKGINCLKYSKLNCIHFYKRNNNDICFSIMLYAPWDDVDGLCWKVRNNKTVYVGYDGYVDYEPWDEVMLWDNNFVSKYYFNEIPEDIKRELKMRKDEWYGR